MTVGPNQQHGASDRVEANHPLPTQIAHMAATAVPPRIKVEGCAPWLDHAMRMDNVTLDCKQLLDNVRWIGDNINIKPQHPILIIECGKQEVISRTRQNRTSSRLVNR